MNPTQASAAAINELISGKEMPSPEKSRHLWLASGALVEVAKQAEHAAFLAMRELENNQHQSAHDFKQAMLKHLGEVKQQLIFLGKVCNG